MTTRIVLAGTSALSDRAKAVQEANRASLEQRQRDAATTAKVAATAPTPPRIGGLLEPAERLIVRPPRFPGGDELAAAVWYFQDVYDGDTKTATKFIVRTGDGSASLTLEYPEVRLTYPGSLWFGGSSGSDTTTTGTPTSVGSGPVETVEYWNAVGGVPAGVSGTIVSREQVVATSFSASDSHVFCLPVGKESLLVVYVAKALIEGYYAQVTTTTTSSRGVREEFTLSSGTFITYGTIASLSSAPSVGYVSDSSDILTCVLVGKDSVREVTAPSGLQAALARFLVDYEALATSSVPSGLNYQTGGVVYDTHYVEEFLSGPVPVPTVGGGGLGSYIPLNITKRTGTIVPPSSISEYLDGFIPALATYGVGFLDFNFHNGQRNTTFSSPAIFTLLSDFDTELVQGNTAYNAWYSGSGGYETYMSYANVYNDYLASTPAPNRFLAPCVLETTCPIDAHYGWGTPGTDTVNIFDVTTTRPNRFDEPASMATFTKGKGKLRINTSLTEAEAASAYSLSVGITWDWGNPSYCRSQLLALGFTPADLTP